MSLQVKKVEKDSGKAEVTEKFGKTIGNKVQFAKKSEKHKFPISTRYMSSSIIRELLHRVSVKHLSFRPDSSDAIHQYFREEFGMIVNKNSSPAGPRKISVYVVCKCCSRDFKLSLPVAKCTNIIDNIEQNLDQRGVIVSLWSNIQGSLCRHGKKKF